MSREPTEEEIDEACKKLQAELDRPMTPREGRLISKFDQIKAQCRDDPEVRERVIAVYIENGSTREDVEAWLEGDDDA